VGRKPKDSKGHAGRESTSSYGYGWAVSDEGSFSHSGSDGTFAWVDPDQGLIVLVFTQTPSGANPRNKFVELVRSAVVDEGG
jgi:CubicO group peptidase (beta-lactamase class C family)